MSDFLDTLEEWKKDRKTKAAEPVILAKPEPRPKVELSDFQKKYIIEYALGGISKGVFEDPEFWERMTQEEVDEVYGSYYEAAENFMDELKMHVLQNFKTV